jgi:hypothetical protein
MKKKCPHCGAAVEKFWPMPKHPEFFVGRCKPCGKLVNLGRADGTNNAPGAKAGEKEGAQKKGKKAGKGARHKAASGPGRKQRVAQAPVPPEPAKKPGGFGTAVRDFFEI